MTLFLRSYLITLGSLFTGGGVGAVLLEWSAKLSLGWLGGIIAAAIAVLGAVLLLVGIFGSSARVEIWADRASFHEGSILVAIVALPLFLLLRLFIRAGNRPAASLPITEIRGKRAERRHKRRQ